MEVTRLQGGSIGAIEAKEHVKLTQETRAMASITYQNLLNSFENSRRYMSWGLEVVESEFSGFYSMSVVKIPTNCPVIQKRLS